MIAKGWSMSKQVMLDRLAQLSEDDLRPAVEAVEQAVMMGDGWLQRTEDGRLSARNTSRVVITERP